MTGAIFIVVVFALMWAVVILPQQRRVKRHQALVAALEVGDEVVTVGGVLGEVVDLDEDEVVLAVAEGVELRLLRGAIAEVRAGAVDGDLEGDEGSVLDDLDADADAPDDDGLAPDADADDVVTTGPTPDERRPGSTEG